MNVRWLLGNFADPQYGLSRADESRVSRLAHEKHMPSWRLFFWTFVALLVPVGLAIKVALPVTLDALGLGGRTLPYVVGLGVILVAFWPWCAWVYRRLYAGPARQAMRELGYDVCVGCGYRLEGLDPAAERCPECGAKREPPRAA